MLARSIQLVKSSGRVAAARCLSTSRRNIAFAFDIDGVLVKGSKTIPQAPDALQLLNDNGIPWIMMTNGGGKTEKERVKGLSKRLGGLSISESQFMQSHTPFKRLTDVYNGKVLVVGGDGDKCRHVAKSYGFKDVVISADIVNLYPSIWPFHRFQPEELLQWADPHVDIASPFDAILVFNDPRDMGADTQIVLDLLLSKDGLLGTRRQSHSSVPSIPIHFSNNDLLWSNDYPISRFGQGAFKATVDALYKAATNGHNLDSYTIGKPFKETYDYANNLLIDMLKQQQHDTAHNTAPTVYMVGDNPASDIIGANNYGWQSILVKTGVYHDGSDLHSAKPDIILDNVLDAVKHVVVA